MLISVQCAVQLQFTLYCYVTYWGASGRYRTTRPIHWLRPSVENISWPRENIL